MNVMYGFCKKQFKKLTHTQVCAGGTSPVGFLNLYKNE